VGHFAAMSSL